MHGRPLSVAVLEPSCGFRRPEIPLSHHSAHDEESEKEANNGY
jgi:hypothetical protein